MTTEAQITANRTNAQKSTGPRTAEGKAIVAQNAIKHGLLARRAVIKDEDPAEFEGYRAAMIESLRPRDAAEESVVRRIVNLSWRLKRAERMQDETLDFLLEADARECQTRHLRSSGDPSGAEELTFGRVIAREFSSGRTLEKLMTYERWIENSLYRSFNELHRLRREQEAVKQSQTEGVSSSKCGVSSEVDPGPLCETKPIGGLSCSTPALGGDPSRGRLGYMSADPMRQTKPIEAAGGDPGRDAHATETPCGGTASGDNVVKQSQSGQVPADGPSAGSDASKQDAYDKSPEVRFRPAFLGQYQGSGRLTRTFVGRVKQSQCQGHIAGDRALLLRARPRVAWHSRGTERS